MSGGTLARVLVLLDRGELRISEHGYDELAADGIFVDDVMAGMADAVVVEDYPDFHKGPSVLVLLRDGYGGPVHVVWGIAKGTEAPAVLVTAYRPSPDIWSADYMKRRT